MYQSVLFLFFYVLLINSERATTLAACQTRRYLSENAWPVHVIAYVLLFSLMMLEGGVDMNAKLYSIAPNDWRSGNIIDTLFVSFGLYILFILSCKMKLLPNVTFYFLIFVIYCIQTHTNYLQKRNMVSDRAKKNIQLFKQIIIVVAIIILALGVTDYCLYQMKEKGSDFSWPTFFLGKVECDSLSHQK